MTNQHHTLRKTFLIVGMLWGCTNGWSATASADANQAVGGDLLKSAHMWAAKNRPDLARQVLGKLLAIDPYSPDALAFMGDLALRDGNIDEARKVLGTLDTQHPQHIATRDLKQLVRIYGEDREKLARMRLLVRAGRREEAAVIAKELFPDGVPRIGVLASEYNQILGSTGRSQSKDRVDRLNRGASDPRPVSVKSEPVLSISPGQRNSKTRELVVDESESKDPIERSRALARNTLDEAESAKQWQAILDVRASDQEALGRLGTIRLRQGDYAQAQNLLSKAAQLDNKWKAASDNASVLNWLDLAEKAVKRDDNTSAANFVQEALLIEPEQSDAILLLAGIRRQEGNWIEAQKLYERLLDLEPDDASALRGLATVFAQSGQLAQAQALLNTAVRKYPALGPRLADRRVAFMRQEAANQIAGNNLIAAREVLERAISIDPTDAWLRHDLARLYLRQQFPQEARRIMNEGVTRVPLQVDMRYARALIMATLDDDAAALADISNVPPTQKTPGMLALELRSSINLAVQEAMLSANPMRAARTLQDAESTAGDETELLYTVANGWFKLAQPTQALAVFERLHQRLSNPSLEQQLDYAQLLNRANADEKLTKVLQPLLQQANWSAVQRGRLLAIYTDHNERVIEQLSQNGQSDKALALAHAPLPALADQHLAPVAAQRKKAAARLLLAAKKPAEAVVLLESALLATPDDLDVRADLGIAYFQAGQTTLARDQALWLHSRVEGTDLGRQLEVLRLLQRVGQIDAAQTLAQRLVREYPQDTNVVLHAARLERSAGNYTDALAIYQRAQLLESKRSEVPTTDTLELRLAYQLGSVGTKADSVQSDATPEIGFGNTDAMGWSSSLTLPVAIDRAIQPPLTELQKINRDIAEIESRRQAWVEVAQEKLEKNSTEGISSLRGTERSAVLVVPYQYEGRFFAQIDQVQLTAGDLPLNASDAQDFGQVAAYPAAAYVPTLFGQSANGLNIGVGYVGDNLRWDIGQIGVGFPVSNVVGGVSYIDQTANLGYSVELSRRPMTGSLLSYAGSHDPVTGDVWGGVVSTGLGGRLSKDLGPFTGSVSARYALLTGQNVQSNTRFQWRASVDHDVVRSKFQTVNVGLALSGLHHAQDLSGFTWGQGGYYSPTRNLTLSLPVVWSGREGALTWLLRGAISTSRSFSNPSDYYPTNPLLQASAGNPRFAGGDGSGFGRSYSLGAEYQATPRLAIGGRLERDFADYYTPVNLSLYARYEFESLSNALSNRPRPMLPYSKF
jgi:cellulose synthase operon protein C